MRARRLSEVLKIDPSTISTEFPHIEHMYTGFLSEYYYSRFDQALDGSKLSPTDRVLEIGGGTGVFTLTLATLADSVHFSDIPQEDPLFFTPQYLFEESDISETGVHYSGANVLKLPYKSDSFDVVFALDVLEHVSDEQRAVSEIDRVTAPDGRAVVSAPIETGVPVLYRELYRYIDGKRNNIQSIDELIRAVTGSPKPDSNNGHRGYDYTQTIDLLNQHFESVSVEFCPVPMFGRLNPTAIIIAR